jgi:hypothetical protein
MSCNSLKELNQYLDVAYKAAEHLNQFILDEEMNREIDSGGKSDRKVLSNLKQQLLILYFFDQKKIFRFIDIHDDKTEQSKFFSYLLNGGYDSIYKYRKLLGGVQHDKVFLAKENLRFAKEVFSHTKFESIKTEISDLISNLE